MSTDHDGHTNAANLCDPCPPLREWPWRNLILEMCPRCSRPNDKAWREAAARRLIEPVTREEEQ